jgi:glycosyltransferase involved in cell wall biosynthesis
MSNQSTIVIMMATFNGDKYLYEQLNSIEKQTYKDWQLVVSDDGSNDKTLDILRKFQASQPLNKVIIQKGPRKGSSSNFISLLADPLIRGVYYAFGDQDDIWLPNKLEVAITQIKSIEKIDLPVLYCGRTINVNQDLHKISESPLFVFPATFRNALVQSIAGGNTMIFNDSLKRRCESFNPVVPVHDWWLYLLATGVGGVVHYDKEPYVLYRQHPDSLIGGNYSLIDRLRNVNRIFKGEFKRSIDQMVDALTQIEPSLIKENREIFSLFKLMRVTKLRVRIRLMLIIRVANGEPTGGRRPMWRAIRTALGTASGSLRSGEAGHIPTKRWEA